MNKSIVFQGKKIFYQITGNGKPVVLIHGFGEDGRIWQSLAGLHSKYRLIIPDLPGSGQSAGITDMSMEGMSDVIKAITENEAISRCTVIGHSMGGYITLAFAERYPDSLNAFGLFHSTAYADSEEKKNIRRKGIEFMQEHGAFPFLENTTPNLFSPESKEKKTHLIENQVAGLQSFSAASLISYYEAMIQRPDRTDVLRKATVPVLFIAGRYDAAVPLADVLKQCHLPVVSHIHQLEHSGHMGMLEEPEESIRILESFLKASL